MEKSMVKQTKMSKEEMRIYASEIGQFHFCSLSWYLQRLGYKPDSPLLDIGLKKHISLGKTLNRLKKKNRFVTVLQMAAVGFLIIAALLWLFEVLPSLS